ncbi:MAG: molybdopterin molybdotransferase MoeA [Deltaproteobacteria bacterium]|nr:molybdopterin molybdotransferase MoeA [Candidatus Anaeroferrophillacea bacterium]
MKQNLTVEEARQIMLAAARPLPVERVDLLSALGRVCAADIAADMDIPPLDNSAMDGYALQAADTVAAAADGPVRLRVVDEVPAGARSEHVLAAGETVRIMTGAPIPDGADAVVRREWVDERDPREIALRKPVPPGSEIRRTGEDVRRGAVVVPAGTIINPATVGMLASVGRPFVTVAARPRIAVLATGDELVDFGEVPENGCIRNSNSYSLAALVYDAGGIPLLCPRVGDRAADVRAALERVLGADIVMTSGGVSYGDYDFVREVIRELAGELLFWKVATKPGRPLAFGVIGGTPVVGLPGNPVSVMVSFEQFVRPMLRKMAGMPAETWLPVRCRALAGEDLPANGNRRHYVRGVVRVREDGRLEAVATGVQGSGILSSMAAGNCFIVVPADSPPIDRGTPVTVEFFPGRTPEPFYC